MIHKCVFDVDIGDWWREVLLPHPYDKMYVVDADYPTCLQAVTVEYETDAEWGSAEDYRDALEALRIEMKDRKVWQIGYWRFVRPEDC